MHHLLVFFGLIFFGGILLKIGFVSLAVNKSIENFIIKFVFPCLIFSSIYLNDVTFKVVERHFIYAYLLGISSVFLLGLFFFNSSNLGLRFMNAFACININTIFFSIPIVAYYLTDASSALLINILQPLFLLPLAIISLGVIQGGRRMRDIFFNYLSFPILVSILLGFLMVKFNIRLPYFAIVSLDYIGKLTYFLAPVCFGANIFSLNQSELLQWTTFKLILILRLLVLPWISALIAYLWFDLDKYWVLSIWIITASPMGFFTPLIAEKFGLNADEMRLILALSSIGSLIMISLGLFFIEIFNI